MAESAPAAKRTIDPSARALLAAIVAITISFVAASYTSRHRIARIDRLAADIAGNASPSVEHLAAARSELRRLQVLVDHYADAAYAREPPGASDIATSEGRYKAEIDAYLALPIFAGERDNWQHVSAALANVDETVERIRRLVQAGELDEAHALAARDLAKASDAASDAILETIAFDAAQAHELGVAIARMRHEGATHAMLLDALCIGFAALSALLAFRVVRRYSTLVEEHARVLHQRNAELDQFAGRVAHDIISPLTTVTMLLDVEEKRGLGDQTIVAMRASARRSVARVGVLIEGLLEFARAGARPKSDAQARVDDVIAELLEDLRMAAAEHAIELRCEPYAPCAVRCNPGVLVSLLANLVRNAIKHMGDVATRSIVLRVEPSGDVVRFEVVDTGPGLPPGMEEAVFEPYVRGPHTKRPGIGLGLATVRRMLEAHGGTIGVRSRPGEGCTFWFELPSAGAVAANAEQSARVRPAG